MRVAGVLPALVERARAASGARTRRTRRRRGRRSGRSSRSARSAFGHSRSTSAAVAGPVVRRAEQDQPQRRGVDRAVVRRVRQLAGAGHLAGPQLVEDLAGLRVALRVVARSPGARRGPRASRPRAAAGTRSAWNEAISASRPNSVVNHGTPAAMYRSASPGPSLTSSRRSLVERLMARLNSSLSVRISDTLAVPRVVRRRRPRRRGARARAGTARRRGRRRRPALTPVRRRPRPRPTRSASAARARRPSASGQCQVSRTQPGIDGPRDVRFDRLHGVRGLAERDVRRTSAARRGRRSGT